MRKIRLGKFSAICSLNSDDEEMLLTWLPCTEDDCVSARPRWSNRSLTMKDLRPSATTAKVAEFDAHPLLAMEVYNLPSIWIGSLENVLSCGLNLTWIQTAWGLLKSSRQKRHEWSITNTACTPWVHEKSSWDVINFDRHIERLDLRYVIFN